MDIIVTIQFTYGGVFLSDPDLRYANGIRIPDKIRVDVDELYAMLFHNLATDLDVEKIETFWCRVNKKGYYYKLENDVDVLSLITPVEPDRADVSSSYLLDINENHPPRAKKRKAKVSYKDLGEELSDFDEELLQVRKANIEKQAKEKADRVNVDEIPSGPVDIDADFEDMCKNKGIRYEGGWKEGCRRIIGLDGAFLKGVCKGILLSCISKDGNNQMYPVAWVVVDKETKDTWSWFLRCISHDLELEENGGEDLTVMSDMQKVARATFEVYLQKKLNEMSELGIGIVEDSLGFKTIITMLEEIRCKVMEKMNQMRDFCEKWITDVSPMAMKVLAENAKYAAKCEVIFNGDMGFEIGDPPYTHKKDLSSSYGSQPSVQASSSTAAAAAEGDANASTAEEMPVNAKSSNRRPAGRPLNAQSAPTYLGRPANAHSAPTPIGRHANTASVGSVRPVCALTADIRLAATVMPTTTSAVGVTGTQSTIQLSTSGVGAQKRNTSTTFRGGANLAYKRPRQKKAKETGFDVLFGPSGSVFRNTDRVLHSPTIISSVPTNIDLGFKPNGLRWKGRAAITQRQLQQQSHKRSKAKSSPTTPTTQAISSTQANKNQSTTSTQATH
ncbi:putative (+)-neomenthol dehydrogenase-like [Capsicum annuum]|nr:putative (+)-neomenthol dehydrogenase-like [Capsicum annuum]